LQRAPLTEGFSNCRREEFAGGEVIRDIVTVKLVDAVAEVPELRKLSTWEL
jgi:hypothetical protein